MMIYNLGRVFKARGVSRPFAYFKKMGFSDTLSSKLKNKKMKRLNMSTIETICLTMRCTPNDLMEWIPDNDQNIDDKHPLQKLRRKEKIFDITQALNAIPYEQLNEIEEIINQKLKDNQ